MSKAAWNFVSSIYKAGWDKLIVDSKNFSFRHKVKIYFNPPSNGINISKKGKDIAKLASISNLPPLILTKSPKEINAISKYFKKSSKNKGKKSYAQTSVLFSNSTREILKIKETFLNLQDKKIKHIQKIISGKNKPKSHFNMTIKRLSRKQVIISMNAKNKNCFMKDLSAHISTINRALKNIKLEIVADFICLDSRGIIITTNNIKIKEGGLDLFYFSFHFLFYFQFIFQFSIFRTTRVRVDWSCCHIKSQSDSIVTRQIMRCRRT